jgi:hypothetical protein
VLTTCAIANRYWDAGADGIYAFNWHSNGADFRRGLLETVGESHPRWLLCCSSN